MGTTPHSAIVLTPDTPTALAVLYEHADFLLVYKPPGLSFHAEGEDAGVLGQVRQSHSGPLFAVHRLDLITSGLILLARHEAAARAFGEMFSGREMEKYYLALATGKPARKQGLIAGGMAPGRGGNWRLTRDAENYAVTQFFSYAPGNGHRLYLLRPRTGRTHQLRVALKSLGVPILGDTRYSAAPADRAYLHAFALGFNWNGEVIRFICWPGSGEHWPKTWPEELASPWGLAWPVVK